MKNTVELLGTYGGDRTHALSAWTSTARDLTPEKEARIGKLLADLAQAEPNPHHTPFEKSMLHFLVTCEQASHIHIIKHRIGVSVNAESARYRELQDKFYVPPDWPDDLQNLLTNFTVGAFDNYHAVLESLVESGMSRKRAKESARFFLPYASQITLDVAFNFRSFMHFQSLRNEVHAQDEIHEIAETMLQMVFDTGDFNLSLKAFGYPS